MALTTAIRTNVAPMGFEDMVDMAGTAPQARKDKTLIETKDDKGEGVDGQDHEPGEYQDVEHSGQKVPGLAILADGELD